jgi:hypothetical protein
LGVSEGKPSIPVSIHFYETKLSEIIKFSSESESVFEKIQVCELKIPCNGGTNISKDFIFVG